MEKIKDTGQAVGIWVTDHPLNREIRNNPKLMAHYLVDFGDWVIKQYNKKEINCPDCTNGLLNLGNGDVSDCQTCAGNGKILLSECKHQHIQYIYGLDKWLCLQCEQLIDNPTTRTSNSPFE